jgi:S-adenosylmethionine hydrolase
VAGIVTLTTDWHNSDYYIGAVKALILSKVSDVIITDISHNITSFSIQQAAFILKSTYKNFPSGTVHIIGVDSEPKTGGNIVVANYKNQYFICNNNGTLGLVFENKPDLTIVIDIGSDYEGSTFPELTVFSEIASFICLGGNIRELGEIVDDVIRSPELLPQIDNNEITGSVIYIDSFSNVITNISIELFETFVKDRNFEILLNSNYHKTNKIYKSYKEVNRGDIVCLFNSLGLLEIAIREGKASLLLNLDRRSLIRIKYDSI